MKKIIIFIFLFLNFGIINANSGEINLNLESSKTNLNVGETFNITLTFKNKGSYNSVNFDKKIPGIENFEILGTSEITNVSIVNNLSQTETQQKLELKAVKNGKYTVGPASIEIGGNLIKSNEITLSVNGSQDSAKTDIQIKPEILDLSPNGNTENKTNYVYIFGILILLGIKIGHFLI